MSISGRQETGALPGENAAIMQMRRVFFRIDIRQTRGAAG
jgi:hypothetical protein